MILYYICIEKYFENASFLIISKGKRGILKPVKIVGSIIELSHMRGLKTSENVGFELLLFAYVRIAFASFLMGKEVVYNKVKKPGFSYVNFHSFQIAHFRKFGGLSYGRAH